MINNYWYEVTTKQYPNLSTSPPHVQKKKKKKEGWKGRKIILLTKATTDCRQQRSTNNEDIFSEYKFFSSFWNLTNTPLFSEKWPLHLSICVKQVIIQTCERWMITLSKKDKNGILIYIAFCPVNGNYVT